MRFKRVLCISDKMSMRIKDARKLLLKVAKQVEKIQERISTDQLLALCAEEKEGELGTPPVLLHRF